MIFPKYKFSDNPFLCFVYYKNNRDILSYVILYKIV